MAILKRKKYINLSIGKSGGWYNDTETEILSPTKVAMVRYPRNCSKTCIFSRICSFWSPRYILYGLDRKTKIGNIVVSKRICLCGDDYNSKQPSSYSYIFTYEESLEGKVPRSILKDMGLIPDPPKKSGKSPTLYDRPQPKYSTYLNNKKYGSPGKNYSNQRRR